MSNNSKPFVVAGCPVKNRGWILPKWFDAMEAQTTKPDQLFLLPNDIVDDTEQVCYVRLFGENDYEVHNTGDAGYDRIEPRYSIENLAALRNLWADRCLFHWPHLTHLWSVDSDIAPDVDVLAKLLAVNEPIVGALVRNSTAPGIYNFTHGADDTGPRRDGTEQFIVETLGVPTQVTMTGACCLYRRDAIDAGLRWHAHNRGEDCGLALEAKRLGISMWVEPNARTRHYMRRSEAPLQ